MRAPGPFKMADMAWDIKCREEDMEFRRTEIQWHLEEVGPRQDHACVVSSSFLLIACDTGFIHDLFPGLYDALRRRGW